MLRAKIHKVEILPMALGTCELVLNWSVAWGRMQMSYIEFKLQYRSLSWIKDPLDIKTLDVMCDVTSCVERGRVRIFVLGCIEVTGASQFLLSTRLESWGRVQPNWTRRLLDSNIWRTSDTTWCRVWVRKEKNELCWNGCSRHDVKCDAKHFVIFLAIWTFLIFVTCAKWTDSYVHWREFEVMSGC